MSEQEIFYDDFFKSVELIPIKPEDYETLSAEVKILLEERSVLEEEKKAIADAIKTKNGALENKLKTLADKKIAKEVECRFKYDYDKAIKYLVYTDEENGEEVVIYENKMTDEEASQRRLV